MPPVLRLLTNNLNLSWRTVLTTNAICSASVSGVIFHISFTYQQRIITPNGVLASIRDILTIFCPGHSWCWYAASGTLNGNACIGKCCNVITNEQGDGTLILSFYCLCCSRNINNRLGGFYEMKGSSLINLSARFAHYKGPWTNVLCTNLLS